MLPIQLWLGCEPLQGDKEPVWQCRPISTVFACAHGRLPSCRHGVNGDGHDGCGGGCERGGGGKGAGPCAPNDADASSTVRCTRCGTCATRERHGAQRRTVRARGASRMLTVLISPGPETARVWHDDGARTACTARRRGAWPVGEVSHPTLARGRASRTCSRAAPATQADSAEGSAGSSAGSETQVCAKTARTRAVPGLHSRFELGMPLESHDNGCYGRVTRAMRDARHRAAGRPPRAAAQARIVRGPHPTSARPLLFTRRGL